jgi:hypothetical protein
VKFILLFFLLSFNLGAKTLIITDSHGEASFGSKLVELIEQKNESVSIYAVGGTTAKDWVLGLNQVWGLWEHHTGGEDRRIERPKTPFFTDLITLHHPDVIIIELGTNLIWHDLTEEDSFYIDNLLESSRVSGAKCFWVGPPDLRPSTDYYERREKDIHNLLLKKIPGSPCKLIPSWNFTFYPAKGGDGIHYDLVPIFGKTLAESWAKEVFTRLND